MTDIPELLILRHGETEWNREGRMQGALDSDLTDLGRAQAAAQAAILQRFDLSGWQALVSPQGRAQATADIALAGLAVTRRAHDGLVEIGVGQWAGKLRAELMKDVPDGITLRDGPDGPLALYEHAPGGEGFAGLRARVKSVIAELTGPSVLITHGITSRMLRAEILGLPTEKLAELPGGQGVVFHLKDGVQTRLE